MSKQTNRKPARITRPRTAAVSSSAASAAGTADPPYLLEIGDDRGTVYRASDVSLSYLWPYLAGMVERGPASESLTIRLAPMAKLQREARQAREEAARRPVPMFLVLEHWDTGPRVVRVETDADLVAQLLADAQQQQPADDGTGFRGLEVKLLGFVTPQGLQPATLPAAE